MDSSKKVQQELAKKLKIRRLCCEETDRARQARIKLSMNQERNFSAVSK